MPKRTHFSVTDSTCTCEGLKSLANDPNNPIEFDAETNEYSFVYPCYGTKSPLVYDGKIPIYHCPFCGGAAPDIFSDRFTPGISFDEAGRLTELLKDIENLDDAINQLGLPENDFQATSVEDFETYGHASGTRWHRMLVYEKLSDTAKIHITDFGLNRIEIRVKTKSGRGPRGDYCSRFSDPAK